ncbi:MAG: cellobiose phosphorylase, partial [Elusimicrobia bacterium]|nr:cellobiose phosphorylase [Elusimicrobiota bacterium]
MPKPLWTFISDDGSFVSTLAHNNKELYFPLCNHEITASITPDLHGDIQKGYDQYLLEPVSRINLTNSKSNRNFWIYINPHTVWSVTGVSSDRSLSSLDSVKIEAGLLWHRVIRNNKKIGIQATITSCIPSSNDPVEIMRVDLTNISSKAIRMIPWAAIPVYARSADTVRDHRHVTSLLNRCTKTPYGLIVKPTLLFNERGHYPNIHSFFVFGSDGNGKKPQHIYTSYHEYIGRGDLENPDAVYLNKQPKKGRINQGCEACAGLKFQRTTIKPRQTITYIILLGITDNTHKSETIRTSYNTTTKIDRALELTHKHWKQISTTIAAKTGNSQYDQWFRWVSIQPHLRRIYGNSYLPDFDYGKGGRGWRDLWQDSLALILTHERSVRENIIQYFSGVRIDGSNATIIGSHPGEFIADRNNIARVWMDHGTWPFLTTAFYINQTGDMSILVEKKPYFKDHHIFRSRQIDKTWHPSQGTKLLTDSGTVYEGTVIEHVLLQHLVQFFNVGKHNCMRLENADWNDGLDMAYEHGESVAFTALYCYT